MPTGDGLDSPRACGNYAADGPDPKYNMAHAAGKQRPSQLHAAERRHASDRRLRLEFTASGKTGLTINAE